MNVNGRFIKIDADITLHWVAQQGGDFFLVWIHLIAIAQWKKSKKPIKIGKKEMYLDRGQFCTSMAQIAALLHLKERRVRTILDTLKENDMIKKIVSKKGKDIPYVAKVVNYDKWQGEYEQKSLSSQSNDNHKSFKGQHKYKGYKDYNNDISMRDIYNIVCPDCKQVLIKGTFDRKETMSCPKCDKLGTEVKVPCS